ncbi:type 1 fimbrial protein [Providencia rettgeri]|nr:fimbrial protein [Providencia rettgeri]ELR5257037.1 type 1 fimbrial protein [Providencia rettgeri]ELT5686926.1 type 1 fimbrial protein [Providencia rettgeri]MBX6966781.1 type 1 fimbrial protein [Providencia rettgeri]MBX6975067.1 type 1 fimbrial protein [Providencia rettgeri]MBX6994065.1 type 1 fimbrial protein [Providencia rettgeri]
MNISNFIKFFLISGLFYPLTTSFSYAVSICSEINTTFPSNNREVILTPETQIDQELENNLMVLLPAECYLSGYTPSDTDLDELDIYLEPIMPVSTPSSTYASLVENQIGVGLKVSNTPYEKVYQGWKIGTVELDYAGRYKLVNFHINNKYWAWHKVREFNPGVYKVGVIRNLVKAVIYDGTIKVAEYPISSALNFDFIIRNNSCSFDTISVTKTLPSVNRSVFTGVNTVIGYSEVPVLISCTPNTSYKIKIRALDPVSEITEHLVSDNNLDNAGSAKGVGIELLYNKSPISSSSGNYLIDTNELPIHSGVNSEILQFGAQYYQINNAVSIGNITSYFFLDVNYN